MINYLKHIFFFLLTILLGAQTSYAKTEFVLPHNQVSFSIIESSESNSFLSYLNNNQGFTRALFSSTDRSDELHAIVVSHWLNSPTYNNPNNYSYHQSFNRNGKTVYHGAPILFYDSDLFFKSIKWNYIKIESTGIVMKGTGSGTSIYHSDWDMFHPVTLINENQEKIAHIPALVAAMIIKKGNIDDAINKLSLAADVVLTVTAVGNLTKLRYLSGAAKLTRTVVAGLEIGTSLSDILLNYTKLCESNVSKKFCNELRLYNFYLQMAVMGGEILNVVGKTKVKGYYENLKTEYHTNRSQLKQNLDADEIKELDKFFELAEAGGRFIAKSGIELKTFLDEIVTLPVGKTHTGDVYRSLSTASETNFGALPTQMTDHNVFSSWGRYDLQGQENALYFSKTLPGNQTELVPHYGNWTDFSTYKFENVQAINLLDLSDDFVRQQLGTQLDDLIRIIDDGTGNLDKAISYEMTNVLSKWARDNGYNGLIVTGARGTNNYKNIILFDQNYVNQILQGITPNKVVK